MVAGGHSAVVTVIVMVMTILAIHLLSSIIGIVIVIGPCRRESHGAEKHGRCTGKSNPAYQQVLHGIMSLTSDF